MPASEKKFDLIIIGSGPGGYVAAIRAGQLKLSVAIIEKDKVLGGTCLNRGCIPAKALLHTAEVLDQIKRSKSFGIEVSDPQLNLPLVHQYKDKVIKKLNKGVEFLMRKNAVQVFQGKGRFESPTLIAVEKRDGSREVLEAKNVLIATGSTPRSLPFLNTDGRRIITSDEGLELRELPASMAILGAGAVGVEFASTFARFGSGITLIEMLPRVLPIEDEEISAELEKSLKRQGITVMTGTQLESAVEKGSGVSMTLRTKEERSVLEADLLLVAVGRQPYTDGLDLERAGIPRDKGFVPVDGFMRTVRPSVYAIGDVVATPQLAHVASAEGILAVEHMAGRDPMPINYNRTPNCTYCHPEVASVGLTEAAAREQGYDVRVGRFPFSAVPKAAILLETEGLIKVVGDAKYDEILGVHMIGPKATELIIEACAALSFEATGESLMRMMHAHPTLTEGLMEAAHALHGQPLGM
ncbi:MAG: dihydrolipoyl dehydrogenase [Acidobacteria bacterium]|nr:dihydrolipoyl dehydrogenase [Acidobacteriota bacterium]